MLVLQQKEKWMICLILMLKMSFVYGLTKKMMAMIKKQDMNAMICFMIMMMALIEIMGC